MPTTTRTRPANRSTGRAQPDAIALIKSDHAAVAAMFQTYASLGPRATKRKRQIAERVIRELSIHATIEEELLYPAARTRVADGAALVKEAKQEHRQLKRLLQRLDKADADDSRADALVAEIRDAVQHHVAEEEGPGGILAGLRAGMTRAELADLGQQLRRAKRMAPTHPHPNAPDSPPANRVVGTAAAAADRVRDRATGRTTRATTGSRSRTSGTPKRTTRRAAGR